MIISQHIKQSSKRLTPYQTFGYAAALAGLILIIGFIAGQIGTAGDRQGQSTPVETRTGFSVLAAGSEAFGQPERHGLVISDEETWTAVWNTVHLATLPRPTLPEVDFNQQVVLVILAGEKQGSGYMVFVRDIVKVNGNVIVNIAEQRTTPVQERETPPTYPYQIVTMPRLDLPVLFRFQQS